MDKILSAQDWYNKTIAERCEQNGFAALTTYEAMQQYAAYYAREMMKWTDPKKQMPPLIEDCLRYLCVINDAEAVVLTYIFNEDRTSGKFYMDFGARNYFEDWTQYVTAYMPVPEYDQFINDQKKK